MQRARELSIATDTIRKRNFIKPKAMPYTTATGKVYDSGDFTAHHDARAGSRATGMDSTSARAMSQGKAACSAASVIATYIEACGGAGRETADA